MMAYAILPALLDAPWRLLKSSGWAGTVWWKTALVTALGMSVLEAQIMVRRLRGLNLVGGDVVEVAPPFDPTGNTALVGATMMFEILCVLAPAVHRRKNL